MAKKIIFLRHGESMGNVWKSAYGSDDLNFLSPMGVLQSKLAGQLLTKLNIKFDLVFTSKLTRARHTTLTVLQEMNDWQREIIVLPGLNEWGGHESFEVHEKRVGEAVNTIQEFEFDGYALVVSHYHTMQAIFRHLHLDMALVPWYDGRQVPNAVPYVYNCESRSIRALDPKDHGPQH